MTMPTELRKPHRADSAWDAFSENPAEDKAIPARRDPLRMSRPRGTIPGELLWRNVAGIGGLHILCLLALVPWLFSWSGLLLCFAGLYVFGTLGINLGFHRLLAHQGFTCPKWLERVFAILGVCCLQEGPARWVAAHRLHHQYSDELPDPHSPLVAFFWAHVGWLLVKNRDLDSIAHYERYARDLLQDPFYFRLERNGRWAIVYAVHAAAFAVAGFVVGWIVSGSSSVGWQLAASWLVWGVIVRTVLVWHITWSVNSLTHLWGYRTYETRENSRNNWLVGLIANGEGWHNNHHAEQRAAAHGHRPAELDITWQTIRLLRLLGLARNVITPKCWAESGR
jgi:stearoyl-CoA desaturase (delta-9 desaturase)